MMSHTVTDYQLLALVGCNLEIVVSASAELCACYSGLCLVLVSPSEEEGHLLAQGIRRMVVTE